MLVSMVGKEGSCSWGNGEHVKEPTQTTIAIGALYTNFVAARSTKLKMRKGVGLNPFKSL
jgi:hypothetical protein